MQIAQNEITHCIDIPMQWTKTIDFNKKTQTCQFALEDLPEYNETLSMTEHLAPVTEKAHKDNCEAVFVLQVCRVTPKWNLTEATETCQIYWTDAHGDTAARLEQVERQIQELTEPSQQSLEENDYEIIIPVQDQWEIECNLEGLKYQWAILQPTSNEVETILGWTAPQPHAVYAPTHPGQDQGRLELAIKQAKEQELIPENASYRRNEGWNLILKNASAWKPTQRAALVPTQTLKLKLWMLWQWEPFQQQLMPELQNMILHTWLCTLNTVGSLNIRLVWSCLTYPKK